MVFSSTVFLFLFLPALLICYYLPIGKGASRRKWRNGILLLFSIGFYAWGEPLFVFVMLASVLLNWFVGLQIERRVHAKAWMIGAAVFDVLLLGVFKYASFLSENLAALTGNDSMLIEIALPIGISFFTFQMMSYIFDVYYGTSKAQKNPLYVALYITLFPQLIAGPIVRYQDIAEQITGRQERFDEFSEGVRRFLYGLGKKVLLANFVAQIADNAFDGLAHPTAMMAWLGAIAYTLQIYFDFSGYSDMAIGLGRMFGFRFAENFDYPHMGKSVSDFSRRWHKSLSRWFLDYVYIPMGGNRVNRSRWIFNLFVVWLLTGIWHGANWTFLIWGMIYFIFIILEKETGFARRLGAFGYLYTTVVIVLARVFFRSADIGTAVIYIGHMFGIGSSGFCDAGVWSSLKGTWLVLIAAVIGATPLVAKGMAWFRAHGLAWIENGWLLLVLIASVLEVVCATYNPFIYFNF